ncbi:MAG: hypothetical protein ACTSRG_20080 [Candidatus Helarchaeota archaeon]
MEEEMKKICIICGEKVIDDEGTTLKKYETYAKYSKICYDCLFLPIKCLKGNITLNEVVRRVSLLRRSY